MPTYVYETIPSNDHDAPRRFEIQQRMTDDALATDPETGEPVRRIITGGQGYISAKTAVGGGYSPPAGGSCCGGGCGCG